MSEPYKLEVVYTDGNREVIQNVVAHEHIEESGELYVEQPNTGSLLHRDFVYRVYVMSVGSPLWQRGASYG